MRVAVDGSTVGARRRILFAIPRLDRGGPDRVFADLLHHVDRTRFDVGVFVTSASGYHFNRLPADVTVLHRRCPPGGLRERYPVSGLVRAVDEFAPDVLISTLRMGITASIAGSRIKVCHIARLANEATRQFADLAVRKPVRARLARRAELWSLGQADYVVCQSVRMSDDLHAAGFRGESTIIGNGIDVAEVAAAVAASDAEPSFGDPSLVFVGRLMPQKGADLLLEAIAAMRSRFPRLGLTLLGDGPDRASLEHMARDLGIAEQMRFLGHVENPLPCIASATALVAPSRYEGFSNVILESLACGTPVMSTADSGASADVVIPGVNGELAPTSAAAEVTAAIVRVIELAPSLGRSAIIADVSERYSSRSIASQYEELIDRAVRSGPHRGRHSVTDLATMGR
jgi:glycosyltransferase involved in cell wall biosynthesis